jgi:hypothetical protein
VKQWGGHQDIMKNLNDREFESLYFVFGASSIIAVFNDYKENLMNKVPEKFSICVV